MLRYIGMAMKTAGLLIALKWIPWSLEWPKSWQPANVYWGALLMVLAFYIVDFYWWRRTKRE